MRNNLKSIGWIDVRRCGLQNKKCLKWLSFDFNFQNILIESSRTLDIKLGYMLTKNENDIVWQSSAKWLL